MTTKRFFYGMIGANVLIILLIGATAYFSNLLISQQSLKLQDAKSQSKNLSDQQSSLIQANKDIQKYQELNNIAKAVVPQDKDQAKTVREINNIASDSGITLKNISFSASNLGQTTTATPTSPSTNTSTTKTTTPPLSQLKTVDGITGVYGLEITITSDDKQPTSYNELITFLEKLENNRRTAHVTKLNIKPKDDGSVSFTIILTAYVKP